MDPIGNLTWKEYYSKEIQKSLARIDRTIRRWDVNGDSSVDRVTGSGGLLSFPHTYLDSTIEPLSRTVNSIYRTDRKKIIALGVMHRSSHMDPSREFSLDGFRTFLGRAGELLDRKEPECVYAYFPKRPLDGREPVEMISEIVKDAKELRDEITPETALIATGDLVHYGDYYNYGESLSDPHADISEIVETEMELLYKRKNQRAFVEYSIKNRSDQWAVGIAALSLLDDDLEHEIFSFEMSDYSKIFKTPPPCLVASIFYGVWKKIKKDC
ncbi:MAG: hypothetical protein ACMUHY_07600 [Thermoplasmatota archaeon]